MATTDGLPAHGEHMRRADTMHMCPECGLNPSIFCGFCHGAGQLTELQLSIWQRTIDDRAARGEI